VLDDLGLSQGVDEDAGQPHLPTDPGNGRPGAPHGDVVDPPGHSHRPLA
jgi:hypothetical protein